MCICSILIGQCVFMDYTILNQNLALACFLFEIDFIPEGRALPHRYDDHVLLYLPFCADFLPDPQCAHR